MVHIAIVTGSTRPGRRSASVARWIADVSSSRRDASFEVVDIAENGLPLLDEPIPAQMSGRDYTRRRTRAWSETIASFDAYVFATPEYNRGVSGALKNSIDFLYDEWNNGVAGFVSWGFLGGIRAVEHLRLTMCEVQVAVVASQVAIPLTDFADSEFAPKDPAVHEQRLHQMLDQVVAWSGVMRGLRTP